MFYSHEILTKREYGVAIVWLVATIGSKGTIRKVARKDILAVKVPKACETITQPRVPLALRLQSSLLWGIARVYGQQTEYLYNDVSNAYMNLIRFSAVSNTEDKVTLIKPRESRQDQLILTDDPALAPELLNDLDLGILDGFNLGNLNLEESIPAASTPMSPLSSVTGRFNLGGMSSPGGSIGSHAGSFGGIPFDHPQGFDGRVEDDYMEDLPFEFDENGELREKTPLLPERRDIELSGPGDENLWDSSMAGSVPHTRSRFPSFAGGMFDGVDQHMQNDIVMIWDRNDEYAPPETQEPLMEGAEPFYAVSGQVQTEASHEDTMLQQVQEGLVRKRRAPRMVRPHIDDMTQLPATTLRQNQQDYLSIMEEANRVNENQTIRKEAQTAARIMVLEHGIGGELIHPDLHSMFSGASLLRALGRKPEGAVSEFQQWGKGTSRAERKEPEAERRQEIREMEVPPEFGLGDAQEPRNFPTGDIGISSARPDPEFGRDGLGEMPWNRSISVARSDYGDEGLQFYSGGTYPSSDIAEPFQDLGSNEIKVTPSPRRVPGRPSGRMSVLGTVPELEEEEIRNFRAELNLGLDEDEFFGAGARLQTQGDMQTAENTLERESFNFLGYVAAKIKERAEDEEIEEDIDFILFRELVKPGENKPLVAAQALHHVLLLASKGLIAVGQEEAYGAIQISLQPSG